MCRHSDDIVRFNYSQDFIVGGCGESLLSILYSHIDRTQSQIVDTITPPGTWHTWRMVLKMSLPEPLFLWCKYGGGASCVLPVPELERRNHTCGDFLCCGYTKRLCCPHRRTVHRRRRSLSSRLWSRPLERQVRISIVRHLPLTAIKRNMYIHFCN